MTRRALLSVSDKTGLVDFARALVAHGFELLSTGGTAKLLATEGLPVVEVADYTGFPEMLDGRVKTLHPKIHGGLLARRDVAAHVAAIDKHGIGAIDVLVVNLYPFEATVAKPDCTLDDAIENIDIGGPAMVRSAAKNWRDVAVLTDASQYATVARELADGGRVGDATRFALAVAAFDRIARYDAAISDWLSSLAAPTASASSAAPERARFPAQSNPGFVKVQDLRYGENPHQQAAWYREAEPAAGSLVTARQRQGKELSYNNLADADAAWECAKSFPDAVACVIVKHANPCGVAVAATARDAYERAFATDPTSAFGGIIAFNRRVDLAAVEAVGRQFVEVLIAPGYDDDALAALSKKANLRVLEVASYDPATDGDDPRPRDGWRGLDVKRIGSGMLVQTRDDHRLAASDLRIVTKARPDATRVADLLFAWRVAQYVKSNAIVFAADGRTLGIGAGQMSRVDSARIASIKAGQAGLSLAGCAVASDAFFPFRDGLDVVVDAGATAVIQPGGSVRDDEVIAAADERGVAMAFTGVRHFRH